MVWPPTVRRERWRCAQSWAEDEERETYAESCSYTAKPKMKTSPPAKKTKVQMPDATQDPSTWAPDSMELWKNTSVQRCDAIEAELGAVVAHELPPFLHTEVGEAVQEAKLLKPLVLESLEADTVNRVEQLQVKVKTLQKNMSKYAKITASLQSSATS